VTDVDASAKRPTRPMGTKVAKEEQRFLKQMECVIRAQAWATMDIAAANSRKAQVI
jgi:hypothetical protein